MTVLTATAATEYQALGLGVVISVAAIVGGYLIRLAVPPKHFPRTAGLLAGNGIVGGFAWWGVEPAGTALIWFLALSLLFGIFVVFVADMDELT